MGSLPTFAARSDDLDGLDPQSGGTVQVLGHVVDEQRPVGRDVGGSERGFVDPGFRFACALGEREHDRVEGAIEPECFHDRVGLPGAVADQHPSQPVRSEARDTGRDVVVQPNGLDPGALVGGREPPQRRLVDLHADDLQHRRELRLLRGVDAHPSIRACLRHRRAEQIGVDP